ncbi:MAG TPA: ribosome recycling factor [Candidatus Cloacimonadota bacterium]|jgi:ribosome recycling factor|nr:ribosome recycling factor [Candidatus Cloacimonadales bacterium]HOQ80450.1 ribosome recycling factor [Candidatus Cloacimonadota bacterium]HPY95924.1 ribosome recycling factor [Candidatus Cloacimonadota bacterium]HQB40895.1 ribosome recycling factor [Candidatus Cloacimonadota bacterium]
MEDLLKQAEEKMKKTLESLGNQYIKTRTGRASASVLDDIKVNYYGTLTPVKQLGNINIPEPRMIIFQPWDKTTLSEIEKAILAANLGITPESDGNIIRLPFPQLTEDKRKDIVKTVKKQAEEAKVACRNIRRDYNEVIKKDKKNSEITEDEEKRLLDEVQKITDKWIEKIDELANQKEKDIMDI